MISSKVIGTLTKTFCQQLTLQNAPICNVGVSFFHTSSANMKSRHGGFYKMDYRTLRERPIGPHKKLPPGVKYDGRVGPRCNYRYIVHYPEDGKYTIKKLPLTKLGGRDPETGRKIIQGVGGGSKWKYRWIDWQRLPEDWPRDGPDLVERVISINYDPVRKPMIALTGYADKLRWQIATQGMKEGDLIKTSWDIPTIPIKPNDGDSHPLGALPTGTSICLLQKLPNSTVKTEEDIAFYAENTCGTVVRKVGDRVIVEYPSRVQRSFDQRCQCVVGKVSIHPLKALHIGTPNRMRWLGMKPRSGLWHRKTGHFGRKIRALPPIAQVMPREEVKDKPLLLTCRTEGTRGRIPQRKKPFPVDLW